jgi:ubiquinone/menaquinone biosynthesis C-methylase UbiE
MPDNLGNLAVSTIPAGLAPGAEVCCPMCKSALIATAHAYTCDSCSVSYPLIGNIPCFSEISNYYGELSKPVMARVLLDAQLFGCKKAFDRHIKDPFIRKYVGDETRSLWIEVIPHDEKSVFLDVGCGWGTATIPISRVVGLVYALDATLERARLVQIRAQQESRSNIQPLLATAIELPIPDSSVDIVAFNGVLEWLGGIDKTRSPRELQLLALRDAWRVLKPGGYLYIGIENRYSLRYFLGDHDDHSFLKFTSLMPRKMADLYCLLRTGEPYYTYTYSLAAYHSLLNEARFESVRSFFPWPDYRNPTSIMPLERSAILRHLDSLLYGRKPLSLRQKVYVSLLRILTAIEGKGRLCHSFLLLAQK